MFTLPNASRPGFERAPEAGLPDLAELTRIFESGAAQDTLLAGATLLVLLILMIAFRDHRTGRGI